MGRGLRPILQPTTRGPSRCFGFSFGKCSMIWSKKVIQSVFWSEGGSISFFMYAAINSRTRRGRRPETAKKSRRRHQEKWLLQLIRHKRLLRQNFVAKGILAAMEDPHPRCSPGCWERILPRLPHWWHPGRISPGSPPSECGTAPTLSSTPP